MNPYTLWPRSAQVAVVLFVMIATGFLLHVARPVLVPIALATLVAFLLHPLVKRLQRLGLNRIVAVLIVVGTASLMIAGMGVVVSNQVKTLADDIPRHQENITQRVLFLKRFLRGGTVEKLENLIIQINEATTRRLLQEQMLREGRGIVGPQLPSAFDKTSTSGSPIETRDQDNEDTLSASPGDELEVETSDGEKKATVEVKESDETPVTTMPDVSPLIEVLAQSGIVILLLLFFLAQQADIRDRIVSVAGRGALATTTKALEDAGGRISRYLLMQFIINGSFGVAVTLGLWAIGVPYAIMWGLLAATLRYIPYIGPWMAAILPIATSLIIFSGWTKPLLVVGLFVVLELFSNNVMEPILYGHSVGVSEVGVILSAIFWAWMWGPIGLVLATPMTVCLVVLGKYVPGMSIFDTLLGHRPPVGYAVRLYQRLLAKDDEEAEDLIQEHLKKHSLIETCDDLLLPTVQLVHHDRKRNQIDDDDARRILDTMSTDLDELPTWAREHTDARQDQEPDVITAWPVIVGVPVHSDDEEVIVEMLKQSTTDLPCRFETVSNDLLVSERLREISEHAPIAVCLSALPPGDIAHTRQLCKRLRQQHADVKIYVGRWAPKTKAERDQQLRQSGADEIVSSIADMHALVRSLLQRHKASAAERTPREEESTSMQSS